MLRSSSAVSRPLARARLAAKVASTASWQVKALVEATPISGPAWVASRRSASRAIVEVGTLTTTAIFCPFARAWRRQRARRLARLRDEEREAALLHHRLAIAELARHIDVDRHARELLEPVFGDHPGIERGATGDDRDALDRFEIEILGRQRHRFLQPAQVRAQRLRDH